MKSYLGDRYIRDTFRRYAGLANMLYTFILQHAELDRDIEDYEGLCELSRQMKNELYHCAACLTVKIKNDETLGNC